MSCTIKYCSHSLVDSGHRAAALNADSGRKNLVAATMVCRSLVPMTVTVKAALEPLRAHARPAPVSPPLRRRRHPSAPGCSSWLGPRATFADPLLFAVLLLASSLTSAFKVSLPLRPRRLDDVGVVRGRLRVAAAARPARNDARRGHERVEPVHVPDEDEEPALPDAVQHGVPRDHGAGRRLRLL